MPEEKLARPARYEDMVALVRALNQQGAEYYLIGGYALWALGYQRATTDIDILVPANRDSADKVVIRQIGQRRKSSQRFAGERQALV